MIRYATDADFDASIPRDGLALVVFKSSTCGPCRALMPEITKSSAEKPHVPIVVLDVDSSPQTARKNGIQAVPTVFLLQSKGGRPVAKQEIPGTGRDFRAIMARL